MSSKLDHIVIGVTKDQFDSVVSWYLAALAPLGYEKLLDFGETVGLGARPKADVSSAIFEDLRLRELKQLTISLLHVVLDYLQ